jgi:arginine deiminase
LDLPITLIPCGGTDVIASAREQWSDGANTVAIKPGEVIAYERNHITNDILDRYGIKVYEIPSSELSRGRGGPRCMSMPFYRENLTK